MRIGLILIGGSLKGIYGHAGVVNAIDSFHIDLQAILGASAGSVVSSFYATGLSQKEIYDRMMNLKRNDFIDLQSKFRLFYEFIFNKAANFTGFLKGDKLESYIKKSLEGKDDFSKTKIPLYIATTNLDTYELTLFNTGKISDKVRASTSIPMLFQPKEINGVNYIDGAVIKTKLPQALLDVEPNLNVIIVSNFSHENIAVEKKYMSNSKLPILEIVRRVFAIQEPRQWPPQIGRTKLIYIRPRIKIPIDIFHPNPADAKTIYKKARDFTLIRLKEEFKHL